MQHKARLVTMQLPNFDTVYRQGHCSRFSICSSMLVGADTDALSMIRMAYSSRHKLRMLQPPTVMRSEPSATQ